MKLTRGFCMLLILLTGCAARTEPQPLLRAHAHNDYLHARPLFDALDCGFCSVEADIHLVDGQLLVAHKLEEVAPERTLQALYLNSLQARVKKRNGGRVYRDAPEFTLLIDIKSEPQPTYAKLREVLQKYSTMLTTFGSDRATKRAITVIVTGNQPRETIARESFRYVACDGTLADLETNPPVSLVPQINAKWTELFTWQGKGEMSETERAKLIDIVQVAHKQGRRVRFWDAPDNPAAWKFLLDSDVDLINTDDLRGLARFLNGSH
jgi:glycerophosphoryl diester phosphodiesterase family protein